MNVVAEEFEDSGDECSSDDDEQEDLSSFGVVGALIVVSRKAFW